MQAPTLFRNLRENLRPDLIAGFSVALVALPLSLGIAIGAGVPPIAGIVSAVVGGLLATFLRGSHVAINGPGNSLIVILATAMAGLGGGAEAFPHVLGVVVVSGAIQVGLAVARAGKLAQATPAAVIQGLLSAIGLIIVGKQLHVMFGGEAESRNPIEVFLELPETVADMNPLVAAIGVLSLAVLVVHPKIDNKIVRAVPAPLWVVLLAIPAVVGANTLPSDIHTVFGNTHEIGPEMLVSIPDNLTASLVTPDFSRIGEGPFWLAVALVTLVTSLENVVSVKAVDKLDPERRASNLDRDLGAMGLSTAAAGMLGGLPVLTVVARSSVNVNHGARTGWSNFFHGAFLLLFVAVLSPVIQEIPLAALAGILVYTGYRLTARKVVRSVLDKGPDHLLVFAVTMLATLTWGLLWGVLVGVLAELLCHLVMLQLPFRHAAGRIWRTRFDTVDDTDDTALLRVHGIANFFNMGRLRAALAQAPTDKHLVADFSRALLVDTTMLEHVHDFTVQTTRNNATRRVELIGLESHQALSGHPLALRVLSRPLRTFRITPRQAEIRKLAEERGWEFSDRRNWEPQDFDRFHFFRAHPLEYRDTTVDGSFATDTGDIGFRLCDLTFDEGRLLPRVYHTTALLLRPATPWPPFMLERKGRLRRVVRSRRFRHINLGAGRERPRNYVLYGADEDAVRSVVNDQLIELLSSSGRGYHLESDGRSILLFRDLRLASVAEIHHMLEIAEMLAPWLATRRADSWPLDASRSPETLDQAPDAGRISSTG